MEKRKPIVSIGLPVYNEETYIQKTLDLILNEQDYPNFELIIADNASNDRTPEICREYASKDSRIHYCQNSTNIGAAGNFKKVVELAQGDYFVWVSGHDLWHPQFLSHCLEVMSKDESIVLCHPQAMWIDIDGQPSEIIPGSVDTTGLEDPISRINVVLWGLGYCYPIYGLIKLSALKQVTLGVKIIGPDILLLGELSLFGTFAHVQKPLLYIRRLADFGDWNRYVEKIFNQHLSDLSATQLFWDMIKSHLLIMGKHLQDSPQKNAILVSIVNCLLTKYEWILTGIIPFSGTKDNSLDEYHKSISELVNKIKIFSNYFEKIILNPLANYDSATNYSKLSINNHKMLIDLDLSEIVLTKEVNKTPLINSSPAEEYISYFKKAKKLQRNGKVLEAIITYEKAIELNPNSAWCYQNLGEALCQIEQWDEAITAYKKAIELNPKSGFFHYKLACILDKLSDDQAILYYSKATELQSKFSSFQKKDNRIREGV